MFGFALIGTRPKTESTNVSGATHRTHPHDQLKFDNVVPLKGFLSIRTSVAVTFYG